jgi:hypothetical protein
MIQKLRNWLISLLGGHTDGEFKDLQRVIEILKSANAELDTLADRLLHDIGELKAQEWNPEPIFRVQTGDLKPFRIRILADDSALGANAIFRCQERCRKELAAAVAAHVKTSMWRDPCTRKVMCEGEVWVAEKEDT